MKKQKAHTVGAFLRLMPISHILNVSRCKYKRHYFVEVLDELDVRYFVSDADQKAASETFHLPPLCFSSRGYAHLHDLFHQTTPI